MASVFPISDKISIQSSQYPTCVLGHEEMVAEVKLALGLWYMDYQSLGHVMGLFYSVESVRHTL